MTQIYARETFSVGGNPALLVEQGSIVPPEAIKLLEGYPADRKRFFCESVEEAVPLAQAAAASGMRSHAKNPQDPKKGTVTTRKLNLDPANLVNKPLAELNLMLEDRKVKPVDTVEEAIGLLSEEFERENALSDEEREDKQKEEANAAERKRLEDEVEKERLRVEAMGKAADEREKMLAAMTEEDRAKFLDEEAREKMLAAMTEEDRAKFFAEEEAARVAAATASTPDTPEDE